MPEEVQAGVSSASFLRPKSPRSTGPVARTKRSGQQDLKRDMGFMGEAPYIGMMVLIESFRDVGNKHVCPARTCNFGTSPNDHV